ncbi:uncharacterized protein [Phyllobates terribilis]|uniref:uncharacterized protein n=1 Tax=Phyllobates terribilis TaxID=111132 RepID=UPI003CCAA600
MRDSLLILAALLCYTEFTQPIHLPLYNAIMQHAKVGQGLSNSSHMSTTKEIMVNLGGGQFHDEVVNGSDLKGTNTSESEEGQFHDDVVNGSDLRGTNTTSESEEGRFHDDVVNGSDLRGTNTTSESEEGINDSKPKGTNATREKFIIEQKNLNKIKEHFMGELKDNEDLEHFKDTVKDIISKLKDTIAKQNPGNPKEFIKQFWD